MDPCRYNPELRSHILSIIIQNELITVRDIQSLLKKEFSDLIWDKSTIQEHLNNLEKSNLIEKQEIENTCLWKAASRV